jgi:hypothetical protein
MISGILFFVEEMSYLKALSCGMMSQDIHCDSREQGAPCTQPFPLFIASSLLSSDRVSDMYQRFGAR